MKSARILALELAIYNFCTPKEWDVTIKEIADGINAGTNTVRNVLVNRGWIGRVRMVSAHDVDNRQRYSDAMMHFDHNPMFDG